MRRPDLHAPIGAPDTIYAAVVASGMGISVVPILFGATWNEVSVYFAAIMLPVGGLGAVVMVLMASTLIPVERPQSVLARSGRTAIRLGWAGCTFLLGAYVASLIAGDVSRLTHEFLPLLGWIVWVSLGVPVAATVLRATPAARARAL